MKFYDINLKNKKMSKITEEKRKNMGFISKESRKKLKGTKINPKTNKPIKKSCYNSENIIKKVIRFIIRQLNTLLNDNIIDKERYYNLSRLLLINTNDHNISKNKNEVFKQLEENNDRNSITNVTVNDYEKINKMTINEIFEILHTSKIFRNYFPFHNIVLINLIKKNKNEYKVNKLLNMTFSQFLLYYQYYPLFSDKKLAEFDCDNNNINYYIKKIESIEEEKFDEIMKLKNIIKDINFKGIKSLFDSIIILQNKKNDNNEKKYEEEYINKYIDITLGYHEFFLKRKRNRTIINKENKKENKKENIYVVEDDDDCDNEQFSTSFTKNNHDNFQDYIY